MKSSVLLLALATAAISSCSTAYKTGQTPDDVYFSPAQPAPAEQTYTNTDQDDRYLRLKVDNPRLWTLDDSYYYENRYNYYTFNNWNNPWSAYTYWNYYYNPYCSNYYTIVNPHSSFAYKGPRIFNLASYNSVPWTGSPSNYSSGRNGNHYNNYYNNYNIPRESNNTRAANPNSGNILRDLFRNSSTNRSNSSSSSNSSNNSSSSGRSSSSGSSGSSSGSSAPVRRF